MKTARFQSPYSSSIVSSCVTDCNFNTVRCPCNGPSWTVILNFTLTLHYITSPYENNSLLSSFITSMADMCNIPDRDRANAAWVSFGQMEMELHDILIADIIFNHYGRNRPAKLSNSVK